LGQCILSWHVVDRGKVLGSGYLRWPVDYDDDAAAHAAELLAVAEASPARGEPTRREPFDLSSLMGLEPWLYIADAISVMALLVLLSNLPEI
jgi:hypothetical protein